MAAGKGIRRREGLARRAGDSAVPEPDDSSQRRSGAETARKVLELLLYFSRRHPTASVRELAEATGLQLPTAHRYVALLKEMDLVEEAGRASYRLGWRAVLLGQAASLGIGLVQVAEPVMRHLVGQTNETVTLFRRAGHEMEAIAQVESSHVIRLTFEPGHRLPLTGGASARVLLSDVDPSSLGALLDSLAVKDPQFAPRRTAFAAEVAETKRRGWAQSREEINPGVWALSVPILDRGSVVACLGVAGPLYRLEKGDREQILRLTLAAAADINEALEARARG